MCVGLKTQEPNRLKKVTRIQGISISWPPFVVERTSLSRLMLVTILLNVQMKSKISHIFFANIFKEEHLLRPTFDGINFRQ